MNSISRQYGVPPNSAVAANKATPDVEFLYKGHLPNIPAIVLGDTQLIKKCGYSIVYRKEKSWSSTAIWDGFLNQKPFIMLTAHGLPHAKSTGYLLVVVPLIAFCLTCILGAFHTRVPRDKGHEAGDESKKNRDGRRSMRWKNALNFKDPDNPDSELITDFKNTSDGQEKDLNEDMSQAYRILEQDYQIFLSECGVSKSGYWRERFHK
ncbi:uncharacterized protein LOC126670672 isoform X2 [Mercurialis annua]|nr:uncharacterized protein LOC126670672 isoform X2 [Mercurialis annua]XP_050220433.1 uncharacterized protein LOC126670672 isoform X2 [Mercurialis annua]